MGMVFFVLGLVFGSFINVLIWRIPRRESIVFPGSHCPDCGKTLSARELIPVVSYLIQKGKCIHCGRRISWQYPAVELITAVGFAFYQWREPSWAALVSKLILFSLLIVAAAIDLRHKRLPNVITIPGMVLGMILAFAGWSVPIGSSLLGLMVSGGLLMAIALLTKGMGMGDVKLAALIGAFIGPWPALASIFIASLAGAVVGSIYLLITKQGRKTPIPFGPFLAFGALIGSEIFL
ncbi:MAG: prepilin peptidase [Limnochordia bacterium]|jgi:leader peptidase (prepilin peptidase)/N-methyltransferase|nr:prepilin peptidase [Bacillota bacterium]HOB08472.1 prepilin peptidase [Limnochordia bacterium]HPZ30921.1 prepilin peptidase [Limnochordia bacterium]HQD70519.1 prepilin peptidase [Limnochordia bacterium]